ncbi:MAG: TetR/AcrR family transcriptional regulator [Acidimicrobiales bacterium]|nr:TetR/AcrR family transcriptional regulator [Acidimicrobiales bacterium]
MTTVDGPTTAKGEQTRAAILAAAIDRFGHNGFRSTSVAQIARQAGVSGTAAYAYFPSKEALFYAAVDEDAAGTIAEGLAHLVDGGPSVDDWRQGLLVSLVGALERHPLAKRLLAGLEPEVTGRVMGIPALEEMRKAVGERLRADQFAGSVRSDVDPSQLAEGVVAIVLSLLMAVVQLGADVALPYADAVTAVFAAAVEPPKGSAANQ